MGCGQLGYSEVAFTEQNRVPGVVPSVVALNMPLYGAARTAPRESTKSACRNCAFPRELESQTEALAVVWRIYDKAVGCGTSQLTIDVVGGVGASPLQWNGETEAEKTKKLSGEYGPVVQWCVSSLEQGESERSRTPKNEDPASWVPEGLCLALFAFIPPTATHISQHRLEPTSVPDRTFLSASSKKNPRSPKNPPSLITALHMSTERTERSSSRGRVLVSGSSFPCPWYSSSHDRIIVIGPPKQQMTGRGGAGNYRSPSCDRATDGPEDYSDTRGREPVPSGDPDAVRIFCRSLDPTPHSFAPDHFHRTWRERKHSLALARPWRHRQSRRVPRAVSQPRSRL